MAQIAQSAVLVTCAAGATAEANARLPHITGPTGPFVDKMCDIIDGYANMGFQASHFGEACRLAREMVAPQSPSKRFMVRDGAFVEVDEDGNDVPVTVVSASSSSSSTPAPLPTVCANGEEDEQANTRVYPTVFCGMAANLLGTGCREALLFLLREGVEPRHAVAPTPSLNTSSFTSTNTALGSTTTTTTTAAATSTDGASARAEPSHIHVLLEREIGAFEPALKESLHVISIAPPPLPAFKSFLSAVVVSGGGIEHDIRRACEAYRIEQYSSEAVVMTVPARDGKQKEQEEEEKRRDEPDARELRATSAAAPPSDGGRFGNIEYGHHHHHHRDRHHNDGLESTDEDALFTCVMQHIARRLMQRQLAHYRVARSLPIPDPYVDTCSWAVTPSEVWCLVGLWLPSILFEALCELRGLATNMFHSQRHHGAAGGGPQPPRHMTESGERMDVTVQAEHEERRQRYEVEARARAETTVVYWAACQEVPVFSPSFADGDVMSFILAEAERLTRESHDPLPSDLTTLKIDLVRDVYYLNKMAMMSSFTGMLICGGGVVKHHICNANLMRNGADVSVFLNNGQEFDGSDGGARPEEAISWGKIRIDGRAVKVYSEVSAVFPLLVASVFVPAVRDRSD